MNIPGYQPEVHLFPIRPAGLFYPVVTVGGTGGSMVHHFRRAGKSICIRSVADLDSGRSVGHGQCGVDLIIECIDHIGEVFHDPLRGRPAVKAVTQLILSRFNIPFPRLFQRFRVDGLGGFLAAVNVRNEIVRSLVERRIVSVDRDHGRIKLVFDLIPQLGPQLHAVLFHGDGLGHRVVSPADIDLGNGVRL